MAAYSTPSFTEGFGTASLEGFTSPCRLRLYRSCPETIGAPESQLQQAYTGALGWAHELTSVGFGA